MALAIVALSKKLAAPGNAGTMEILSPLLASFPGFVKTDVIPVDVNVDEASIFRIHRNPFLDAGEALSDLPRALFVGACALTSRRPVNFLRGSEHGSHWHKSYLFNSENNSQQLSNQDNSCHNRCKK
jgi:hypothetical protein